MQVGHLEFHMLILNFLSEAVPILAPLLVHLFELLVGILELLGDFFGEKLIPIKYFNNSALSNIGNVKRGHIITRVYF